MSNSTKRSTKAQAPFKFTPEMFDKFNLHYDRACCADQANNALEAEMLKRSTAPEVVFKFTPADFEDGLFGRLNPEMAAEKANILFQNEMSKWFKVFSCKDNGGVPYEWSIEHFPGSTHFAYLTPPQLIEVEECEHEPKYKWLGPEVQSWVTVCKHCGVELEVTYTVKKDGT